MGKRTWLTPYVGPWEAKTGQRPNCGRLAKELGTVKKALVKKGLTDKEAHGVMLAHWRAYVDKTPARFLSPTRFRETFSGWDPDVLHRLEVDRRLDAEQKRKEAAPREGGMGRVNVDVDEMLR